MSPTVDRRHFRWPCDGDDPSGRHATHDLIIGRGNTHAGPLRPWPGQAIVRCWRDWRLCRSVTLDWQPAAELRGWTDNNWLILDVSDEHTGRSNSSTLFCLLSMILLRFPKTVLPFQCLCWPCCQVMRDRPRLLLSSGTQCNTCLAIL